MHGAVVSALPCGSGMLGAVSYPGMKSMAGLLGLVNQQPLQELSAVCAAGTASTAIETVPR